MKKVKKNEQKKDKKNDLLDSVKIEANHFLKVYKNVRDNQLIYDYYSTLQNEFKEIISDRKLESLNSCNQFWTLDFYKIQNIKDFQRTNLCKDKFCNNCKKVKQASRMSKFIPLLEPYKKNLYQMVLTMPNVIEMPNSEEETLRQSIKKLFKAFATLIEYLKGKERIKGLDFLEWGYMGAIRSLEITFKNNEYHPHLHIAIAMTGKLGKKEILNQYSHDRYGKKKTRAFSEKEILIQKIWYLLINGQKVTKQNIDNLKVGYACTIDKFKEDDFLELFKYMTKAKDEDKNLLSYNNFKILYFATHSIRQIQGYGAFYNIKDDDIEIDKVDEIYQALIEMLQEIEMPETIFESIEELTKEQLKPKEERAIIISRKKIYKYLREVMKND